MSVREAELSDVVRMARVMVDSFLTAHRGQIPEEVWRWRQQNWTYEFCGNGWERTLCGIADSDGRHECVYVATDVSGTVIGLAMGQRVVIGNDTAAGEICALYLHPDHQRQGHGRQLVAAVASRMAQWDLTTLQIGTLQANVPARCFYESLGGRIIGEREVEDAGFLLPEVVYGWSDLGRLISQAAPEAFSDLPFDVSTHREALKSFEKLKLAAATIRPALRARETVAVRFPDCTFTFGVTGNPDAQELTDRNCDSVAFEVIAQADSPSEAEQVCRDVERYFLRHYPGRILSQTKDPQREKPSGNCVYIACYASDK